MQTERGRKEYTTLFDFYVKEQNVTASVNLTLLVYTVQPFNYSQSGNRISFIAPELDAENGPKGASITFITHDGAASKQENVLQYTETVRNLLTHGAMAQLRRDVGRIGWFAFAVP